MSIYSILSNSSFKYLNREGSFHFGQKNGVIESTLAIKENGQPKTYKFLFEDQTAKITSNASGESKEITFVGEQAEKIKTLLKNFKLSQQRREEVPYPPVIFLSSLNTLSQNLGWVKKYKCAMEKFVKEVKTAKETEKNSIKFKELVESIERLLPSSFWAKSPN